MSSEKRPAGQAKPGFTTRQVHAGVEPDPLTGAILTPIYQTTTYVQESVDRYLAKGYSYSRSANPTVRALENKLTDLEGGSDTICFGTGMAAINGLFLAFLSAGDHAIVSDVVYGGTYRLSTKIYSRFGVEFSFVDTSDTDAVRKAIRSNTKLILTETPANPTLKLTDLRAVSDAGTRARHSARRRQHFPDAVLPAAAGAGCGHGRAQHHEVFRRAQRDRRRCNCRQQRSAGKCSPVHHECDRHDHVAAGCLADAAGLQDPVGAHGPAGSQCHGDCAGFSRRTRRSRRSVIRASRASRSTNWPNARLPVLAR